jgi:hypothetical protein
LRALDWTAFARGYNGAGFAKNRYHTRLRDAYVARPASEKHTPHPPSAELLLSRFAPRPPAVSRETDRERPAPAPTPSEPPEMPAERPEPEERRVNADKAEKPSAPVSGRETAAGTAAIGVVATIWAYAGPVFGVLAFVAVAAGIGWYFWRRRKRP